MSEDSDQDQHGVCIDELVNDLRYFLSQHPTATVEQAVPALGCLMTDLMIESDYSRKELKDMFAAINSALPEADHFH